MIFERFLPRKFSSRLFLTTFFAGVIPIVIFTILINTYGQRIANELTRIIEEGYHLDNLRSASMLREMGEASVYSKVLESAQQLDLVLESVPWMNMEDLQGDRKFRELAVQSISNTGHTYLFDADTAIIRFHRDKRLEGMNLYRVSRNLPEFVSLVKTSLQGPSPGRGYYRIKAGDGNIMERYMCIVPLRHLTADGARLMLAASVNAGDFAQRIDESQAIHDKTKNFLIVASRDSIQAFRHQGLLFMGIGILTVSLLAFVMGRYSSRGVTLLREATSRVNAGDYSIPVPVKGRGEVARLMNDFNGMVDQLAATTVSKQLLQASEVRLKILNSELRKEINERKRTEQALAEEKERLNVTLRSIGEGVIAADSGGRVILINGAAEMLTGWLQSEAIGNDLEEVFQTLGDDQVLAAGIEKTSALGQWDAQNQLNRKTLVARDGAEKVIVETSSPIRDRDGASLGTVIVFRDITDQRKLEEELLRARKLESLGVLAGGIAHDFNNLLAVILGNISFAKMMMRSEEKALRRLVEAENACMRGKDLTYQLLAFARGGEPAKQAADIEMLLRETVESALVQSKVVCAFDFPEDLSPVTIDDKQIRQVIERMVGNAVEAMEGTGNVTVGAENVTIGSASPLALKPGEYVRIYVHDEGPGIPEEDLQRIFDPYFTRKQMGNEKGTGLGLSISYAVVKDHGGIITVESGKEKGTRFDVYLPAGLIEETIQPSEISLVESIETTGFGKLLFMDDDEGVRDVIVDILRHLGYEVEYAREGAEAIRLYTAALESGAPFDILIADLTVRDGMGGRELIERLRSIDPAIKAVISSGYSNDPVLFDFKKYGFIGMVAKPYKIEELCTVVDRIMSDTASDGLDVEDAAT
jgi:PAS domain S-box-containing protein